MKLSFSKGQFNPVYTYYGQMGEDSHIHRRYFPSFRNGVFLEMGAHNGITFSNSKFFEDTLNWSGVLIEPNPSLFEDLCKNRPKTINVPYAISKTEGELEFYKNCALSSVKSNTTEDFFRSWHTEKTEVIKVPSIRLDSVLHKNYIKRIDFWSLDVEGSEYEALETMDWSIPVYLICIETQTGERKKQCDDILIANGFKFIETLAHNEIWINPAHRRKD
jgi:FkbM family methyltransferase